MYDHIDKQSLTLISGPFSLGSNDMKRAWLLATGTHRGNFGSDEGLAEVGIVPRSYPSLTSSQKYGDVLVFSDHTEMEVVDKTAEELEAILEANIDRLDQACRAHLDKHAHWTAGNMVGQKAQQGKAKAQAVWVWAETVWALYYDLVDGLRNGTVLWEESLLTSWPACPYTMRQVRDE